MLQLGWSLAGTTGPGDARFELQVPPCPTSSLRTHHCPSSRCRPSPRKAVLLTRSIRNARSAREAALANVRFGGRAKSERWNSPSAPRAASVVAQAKLAARNACDLSPGQLTAFFEYDLHPARGSADEWTFDADPSLRITERGDEQPAPAGQSIRPLPQEGKRSGSRPASGNLAPAGGCSSPPLPRSLT